VVVLGNCVIHGPAVIQGTLVVTGSPDGGQFRRQQQTARWTTNPGCCGHSEIFPAKLPNVDKNSIIATFN